MPLLKDYIYLAGIIDGEGCFNIAKNRKTLIPRILVTNTNKEIVEWLKDNFGGDITLTKVRGRPSWKPAYMWRLSNQRALDLAYELYDYLIIKFEHSAIFCTWKAIREVFKKNDRREGYDFLKEQLSILNKRGNYAIAQNN